MFQGFRGFGGVSFSPSNASAPAVRPRLRVRVGFRGGATRIFGIEGVNASGTSLLTGAVTGRG